MPLSTVKELSVNMSELVSVIVPVYNVELYVRKCIESLLNQTFTELEIIIVDDGSTDDSGKICDELSTADKRVKVFHKQNGGLSDARNYGLKKISGSWVTFIDSDDYVYCNYVENLYNLAIKNNADISICEPVHVFNGKQAKFKKGKIEKEYSSVEAIKTLWYQTAFLPSAWGKLYKSSIFKNIEFKKGIIFEDIDIMHKIFARANKIVYTNGKYYAYVHRENSITMQKFKERDLYILNICKEIREFALRDCPELVSASTAYSIVGNMRVYLNAPIEYKNYTEMAAKYIEDNGGIVLKDPQIRIKTRIGIIMFFLNKKLLKIVYSKVNRWK